MSQVGMKVCKNHETENCVSSQNPQPFDNFYKRKRRGRVDFHHTCTACMKKNYAENKNGVRTRHMAAIAKRKDKIQEYAHKKLYGLESGEYNRLFKQQGGRCKVCTSHQSELRQSLCVDHDHTTGEVRGLLCNSCNRGIGYFQDSPEILRSAIDYLKRTQ